jgi:hypothetical protein
LGTWKLAAVKTKWTEREVAELKRLAGTMPVRDLVDQLQRSQGAITAKAFSLRLSLEWRNRIANRSDE